MAQPLRCVCTRTACPGQPARSNAKALNSQDEFNLLEAGEGQQSERCLRKPGNGEEDREDLKGTQRPSAEEEAKEGRDGSQLPCLEGQRS